MPMRFVPDKTQSETAGMFVRPAKAKAIVGNDRPSGCTSKMQGKVTPSLHTTEGVMKQDNWFLPRFTIAAEVPGLCEDAAAARIDPEFLGLMWTDLDSSGPEPAIGVVLSQCLTRILVSIRHQ